MINFFESTLQMQTNDKKAKTLKYVSAGIGVLSSAGIGLKIGSVMSKYEAIHNKLSHGNFFDNLQKGVLNFHTKMNGSIFGDSSSLGKWGQIGFTQRTNANYYSNVVRDRAFKKIILDNDPVGAVNYLQNVGQTFGVKPEHVVTPMDLFFGQLGVSLNKIPIIHRVYDVLIEKLGYKYGTTLTVTILGVLVIVFIIGLYYLIKFLYKKWKNRKIKSIGQ